MSLRLLAIATPMRSSSSRSFTFSSACAEQGRGREAARILQGRVAGNAEQQVLRDGRLIVVAAPGERDHQIGEARLDEMLAQMLARRDHALAHRRVVRHRAERAEAEPVEVVPEVEPAEKIEQALVELSGIADAEPRVVDPGIVDAVERVAGLHRLVDPRLAEIEAVPSAAAGCADRRGCCRASSRGTGPARCPAKAMRRAWTGCGRVERSCSPIADRAVGRRLQRPPGPGRIPAPPGRVEPARRGSGRPTSTSPTSTVLPPCGSRSVRPSTRRGLPSRGGAPCRTRAPPAAGAADRNAPPRSRISPRRRGAAGPSRSAP